MQATTKVTTLWLLSGYAAPLHINHFVESSAYAADIVASKPIQATPAIRELEQWLSGPEDLANQCTALAFMQTYWHLTFNVVGVDVNRAMPPHLLNAVPTLLHSTLWAIVDFVSTMP